MNFCQGYFFNQLPASRARVRTFEGVRVPDDWPEPSRDFCFGDSGEGYGDLKICVCNYPWAEITVVSTDGKTTATMRAQVSELNAMIGWLHCDLRRIEKEETAKFEALHPPRRRRRTVINREKP
jgi:hypothetical protein